jgi:hypothetical protein
VRIGRAVITRWLIQVESDPGVVANTDMADHVCAQLTSGCARGAACVFDGDKAIVAVRYHQSLAVRFPMRPLPRITAFWE